MYIRSREGMKQSLERNVEHLREIDTIHALKENGRKEERKGGKLGREFLPLYFWES